MGNLPSGLRAMFVPELPGSLQGNFGDLVRLRSFLAMLSVSSRFLGWYEYDVNSSLAHAQRAISVRLPDQKNRAKSAKDEKTLNTFCSTLSFSG
jgi:hypothetical protein